MATWGIPGSPGIPDCSRESQTRDHHIPGEFLGNSRGIPHGSPFPGVSGERVPGEFTTFPGNSRGIPHGSPFPWVSGERVPGEFATKHLTVGADDDGDGNRPALRPLPPLMTADPVRTQPSHAVAPLPPLRSDRSATDDADNTGWADRTPPLWS